TSFYICTLDFILPKMPTFPTPPKGAAHHEDQDRRWSRSHRRRRGADLHPLHVEQHGIARSDVRALDAVVEIAPANRLPAQRPGSPLPSPFLSNTKPSPTASDRMGRALNTYLTAAHPRKYSPPISRPERQRPGSPLPSPFLSNTKPSPTASDRMGR